VYGKGGGEVNDFPEAPFTIAKGQLPCEHARLSPLGAHHQQLTQRTPPGSAA
jgi:hypothetical protein